MEHVTEDSISIALERCGGFDFENFAQEFMASILGVNFKPVGGINDYGKDGLFEIEGKPNRYLQISIQKTTKQKIAQTIKRLQDSGHQIKALDYITSIEVHDQEIIQENILEDKQILVNIKDKKYIIAHRNHSHQTIFSFKNFLQKHLDFLNSIDGNKIARSTISNETSIYVFLQQELETKNGDDSLINAVTDTLIIWSLENTDPEKNKFMNKKEIYQYILKNIPIADKVIKGSFDARLNFLSNNRLNSKQKEIQYYTNQKYYCLPYSTRQKIAQDNLKDEHLCNEVFASINLRVIEKMKEYTLTDQDICSEKITDSILYFLQKIFEKKGIEFGSYLSHKTNEESLWVVDEIINDSLSEKLRITGKIKDKVSSLISIILRNIAYDGNSDERQYLNKLSKTYSLLFSLKADINIFEYFQQVSSKLKLYIGSDILVRILSEKFLNSENQNTVNMLNIIKSAGVKLILTELALDEVWNNMKASDFEYKNHIAKNEQYMTEEKIQEISKILVRAYLYNRKTIQSWNKFIDCFCTYSELHNEYSKQELEDYLKLEYGMEFITSSKINELTSSYENEIDQLSENAINACGMEEVLANNKAKIIYLVYEERARQREQSKSTGFGFNTWWLTDEKKIFSVSQEVIKNNHSHYAMRPYFLLNYISMMPSKANILETHKSSFPNILGTTVSERLKNNFHQKTIDKIKELEHVDKSRIHVKVERSINQLMGNGILK